MRTDVKRRGWTISAEGNDLADRFLESVFFTGNGRMGARGYPAYRPIRRPLLPAAITSVAPDSAGATCVSAWFVILYNIFRTTSRGQFAAFTGYTQVFMRFTWGYSDGEYSAGRRLTSLERRVCGRGAERPGKKGVRTET